MQNLPCPISLNSNEVEIHSIISRLSLGNNVLLGAVALIWIIAIKTDTSKQREDKQRKKTIGELICFFCCCWQKMAQSVDVAAFCCKWTAQMSRGPNGSTARHLFVRTAFWFALTGRDYRARCCCRPSDCVTNRFFILFFFLFHRHSNRLRRGPQSEWSSVPNTRRKTR